MTNWHSHRLKISSSCCVVSRDWKRFGLLLEMTKDGSYSNLNHGNCNRMQCNHVDRTGGIYSSTYTKDQEICTEVDTATEHTVFTTVVGLLRLHPKVLVFQSDLGLKRLLKRYLVGDSCAGDFG